MPITNSRLHRRRLLRKLLYLPSILTLAAAFYAPEFAALAISWLPIHLGTRSSSCKIHVPRTWIIQRCDAGEFYAISAPGIARIGFAAWWHDQVPDSVIFFHRISHPEDQLDRNVPLHGVTILEKHTFPYGDQSLTCWDLADRYYTILYPDLDQKRFANIQCLSDREDLDAALVGWRGYTLTFFDVLREIPATK